MKAYVVERGSGPDRNVVGVYSTLERAKAEYPKEVWHTGKWGAFNTKEGQDSILIVEFDIDEV